MSLDADLKSRSLQRDYRGITFLNISQGHPFESPF